MSKIRVSKIRPVSWNVYVQGKEEADEARNLLATAGVRTSHVQQQPGLTDPPIYGFLATPDDDVPMTCEELEAILRQDERVELVFEQD